MAKYLDETGLAHFYGNIKKQFSNEAQGGNQVYIARISSMDNPAYKYGQGSCLLSDTNMVCSVTTQDSSGCMLYNIDLSTKSIINTYSVAELGHCNDLFYDANSDAIYAALNSTTVHKLSSSTFAVSDSYTFAEGIKSIFEHDGELYAATNAQSGVVTIRKMDFANSTLTPRLTLNLPKSDNAAIQTVRAHDGFFYVLMGGNEQQYIYKYDEQGKYLGVIGFTSQVGYFYVTEYESFNFTSHGDIVLFSQASIAGYSTYANVISAIDLTGHISNPAMRTPSAPKRNIRVKYTDSYNERLAPTGDSGNQFMSIEEAIAFGYVCGMSAIYLESNASWLGSGASGFLNVIEWTVYINANSKTIYFGDANSNGPELTGLTLEITGGTVMNGQNGGYLRLYNSTLRLVGVAVDGTNATNVAPLRFNACSVFMSSGCSKSNLTLQLLCNDSFVIHPAAAGFVLVSDLYSVAV